MNNTFIINEPSENSSRGTHGFREINIGATDFDTNTLQISSNSGSGLADLTISSTGGAFVALATIDQVLENVVKQQAKLGVIQPRLGYKASAMKALSVSMKNTKISIQRQAKVAMQTHSVLNMVNLHLFLNSGLCFVSFYR